MTKARGRRGRAVQQEASFDPRRMIVWTALPPRALRNEDLADEFRQFHEAHAFLVTNDGWPDERPDVDEAVAHVRWQLLRYDVLVNAGQNPLVFTDDTDADLGHLSFVLLDDAGMLKEDLRPILGEHGFGNALLYLDAIDVAPEVDTYMMAVELMEHVIRHHSSGCFGAVYFRGVQEVPDVGIERALRFLEFKKVGNEPIYFTNLEHRRPELPEYG
jgi:hypothetical protein